MDFDGPLHECSIYDNDLAGEKLRAMLALGQSKDWQTALEALTGTRELSGKSINKMINYLRIVKLQHPIRGLQIKLNYDYSLNDANINGQKIKPNKKYYVATTDYLLDGGDKMYFLAETTKTIDINYKMRDVLIDYFKKNDTIKLATDNRFIRIK